MPYRETMLPCVCKRHQRQECFGDINSLTCRKSVPLIPTITTFSQLDGAQARLLDILRVVYADRPVNSFSLRTVMTIDGGAMGREAVSYKASAWIRVEASRVVHTAQ